MLPRHAISDPHWERVKDLLPTGGPEADNRRFLDAVLWVARTGAPWRDLPERLGHWNSQWRRFDRWAKAGVWQRVFEVLQDPDTEWLLMDSTVIRAHPCAAGAKKTRTAAAGRRSRPSAAAGAGSAPKRTCG
jgi:transposase